MYEDEIMETEEVVESPEEEEVVEKSNKGLIALAIAGVAAIGGTIAYKKLIKPLIEKRKAKKEHDALITSGDDCEFVYESDDEEETN